MHVNCKMALEIAEGKREIVIRRETLDAAEAEALESGKDERIYAVSSLNYLKLTGFTKLTGLSSKLSNLNNLLQLVVTNTAMESLPDEIGTLSKLKLLDTSYSKISTIPQSLYRLSSLQTLVLSNSCLDDKSFPEMPEGCAGFSSLQHLNLGQNQLSCLPAFVYSTLSLLELVASDNAVTILDGKIGNLSNLKVLELKRNKLTSLPYEFASCLKLKTLNLEDNPVEDRRLMKLIVQHGAQKPKAVLDYVATHAPKPSKEKSEKGKKGKVMDKEESEVVDDNESEVTFQTSKPQVIVIKPAELLEIKTTTAARRVRPYVVFAAVRGLDLASGENFKQFIAIQTKLHDTVCKRRRIATIATHDMSRIVPPLTFDCGPADSITITPLGWTKTITVQEFLDYIEDNKPDKKAAAKKQKASDTAAALLSKYLDLVNSMEMVHLLDKMGSVLSLPPLTNSELSKISPSSTEILLEVTSSDSLASCKKVMDSLIAAMCCEHLYSSTHDGLMVEQVKVVDAEGQLLVVYPSRPDLIIDTIEVKRTA